MAAQPVLNGRLHADIGPALHKKVHRAAKKNDESMTKFVARAIRAYLAKKEGESA